MSKNPRIVVDAFLPDTLAVGDIILRPISAGTALILEKIKSPIVDDKVIAAARKNKGKFGAELSNEDVARIIFILTHPGKESLALWNRGPDVFEEAVYDYLDRIPVADVPALGLMINKHFEQAFSTIIGPEVGQRPPDAPSDLKKNDAAVKPGPDLIPGTP
jgi:hypothetical protein